MTEPKPAEQYDAARPAGESVDPIDEFAQWDVASDEALQVTDEMVDATLTMPRISGKSVPQPPTLLERVDNLEALVFDLLKRTAKLEAFP